jgi:hypothetical protein
MMIPFDLTLLNGLDYRAISDALEQIKALMKVKGWLDILLLHHNNQIYTLS